MPKKFKVLQSFFNTKIDEWHLEGQLIEMKGYGKSDIDAALATRLIEEIQTKKPVETAKKPTLEAPQAIEEDSKDGESNSTKY